MKKIFCLLLAMLMLFGLCACGRSAAPGAADAAPAEAPAAAEEAPDVTYTVTVTDKENNPIPGVKLQFCDDSACRTEDTDASGAAVFTAKEGTYTVHVLTVPEGVVGTEKEFSFPDTGRELRIALEIPKPVLSRSYIGFSYFTPEKYKDLKGDARWEVNQLGEGVYSLDQDYYAKMSADFFKDLEMEEIPEIYWTLDLFDLMCVQKDESEAEAYLKDTVTPRGGWGSVSLEVVGTAENLTCFLVEKTDAEDLEQYRESLGEYYEEYAALRGDKEAFLSGIRLQKPTDRTLLFETADLDGNAVSMADIYAGHKVTMVNVWDIWCEPCIEEMPELEKLNRKFEEKDCQIVGLCLSYHAGADTSEAKEILENAGVTYLTVVAPENEMEIVPVACFPTSFFVDSSGKVLTIPFEGAPPSGYMYLYSNELETALSKLEG